MLLFVVIKLGIKKLMGRNDIFKRKGVDIIMIFYFLNWDL